ncbi:hypothetical protein SJAV_17960 [Sulfurisphaera javensis]|uniref:DUF3211 domain-containing protein n=1 Tax=Sulfurisphaera javensis TaxID=2049879 RepID=A0AAT9GTA9_9CREN
MEEEFIINHEMEDEVFKSLFSDPDFVFANIFKGEVKFDKEKRKFTAYIPLKGFFIPYNLVLEVHICFWK